MKNNVFYFTLCILHFAFCIAYAIPAFPGAEGWGADSRGGRSGVVINNRTYNTRVIHVTNLNSSGIGSLPAALASGGPRVVVFDVSGVINMNNANMTINSWCYVAGQTSPGGIIIVSGGIMAPPAVTDATLFTPDWRCTQDLIIRFVRGRSSRYWGGDDNLRIEGCRDVIVDHCSFTNCCDEIIDAAFSYNITFSWCFVSESNIICGGERNRHGILSHQTNRQSLLNSFLSHHDSRVPLFSDCYTGTCVPGSGPFEVVGNVCYNNSASQTFVNNQESANIVGNYIKGGSDYRPSAQWSVNSNMQVHVAGNYHAGNPSQSQQAFCGGSAQWSSAIIQPANFTTTTGQQAVQDVKAHGGVIPWDSCDARLFREMETGTGSLRLVSSTEQNTQRLIPRDPLNLPKWQRPLDTDNDAMPDYWELAHGLDPNDATDVDTPMNGGYDAIEVYVNELADTLIQKGRWPLPLSLEEARHFHAGYFINAMPNPMRGFTRFSLQLPLRQHVTLDVYDVRGARVARVLNGEMDAGGHSVDWRAGRLGAGIYFARVNMGPYTCQKRLLVLN